MAFKEGGNDPFQYLAKVLDYATYLPLGGVQVFGYNNVGKLGTNNSTNYSSPVVVASGYNWTSVSIVRSGVATAFLNERNQLFTSGALINLTNKSFPLRVGSLYNWSQVAPGGNSTAAIKTDGTLWTWGMNQYGALGLLDLTNRSSPVQVGTLSNWSKVACGTYHTAAIKTDGTLWTCGLNQYGTLGLGDLTNRSSPTQVGTLSNWSQVACNFFTSMFAIKTDGTLWAWGYNSFWGLGLSDSNQKPSPVQVGTASNWSQVACGYQHTLSIKTDGTLWTWGLNSYGQLGLSDLTNRNGSPVQVGALSNWSQIVAGYDHTAAIKTDGTLWAWGANSYGGLGLSDQTHRSSPVQVGTLTNWSKVSCGAFHIAAINSAGTLWTWGLNAQGQLGLSDTTNRYSPMQVGTLSIWSQVVSGSNYTASINSNGQLWTWGINNSGQLGINYIPISTFPIKATSRAYKQIAASDNDIFCLDVNSNIYPEGLLLDIPWSDYTSTWITFDVGRNHFVGIKTNGTAWSTGNNSYGQLGISDTTYRSSLVQIGTRSDWTKVYCSDYGAMLVDNSYGGYVFGKNDYGQLGLSDQTHRSSPVQIGSISISTASMDDTNIWIVDTTNAIWEAGRYNTSYFPDGQAHKYSPVQVGTASNWSKVACGGYQHTAAIKADGTLWSCGLNSSGQLGLGDTATRSSPVQVGALSNWSQIVAGYDHTVSVKTDGTLWSWGRNSIYGALGLGDLTYRSSPTQVGTASNWSQVAGIGQYKAALKTDGTLWSWGYNGYGCLGLSDTVDRSSPVQVGALSNWSKIACGYYNMTSIKTDGTLWSWGANSYGQLGLSDQTHRYSPVQVGTLSNWSKVACGWRHTASIKTDGTLWVFGSNNSGQLGLSDTTDRYSPVQVGTLSNWSQISGGYYYTAAINSAGALWIWGNNQYGPLGLSDTTDRYSPVQVGTLSNWSQVAGGQYHTASIKTDGTLWTWGMNTSGNLGDYTIYTNIVKKSVTGDTWNSVSTNLDSTLFTKTDGSIWALGNNTYGALGTGNTVNTSSPVRIGLINTAVKVEVKNYSAGVIFK